MLLLFLLPIPLLLLLLPFGRRLTLGQRLYRLPELIARSLLIRCGGGRILA